MTAQSYRISDQLYIVRQTVATKVAKKAEPPPCNHILVVDCSGSMSGELPKIRQQLKLKVPKILKEKDTLSIIWFSSRGEHGVLLEGEQVGSLKDLKAVEDAIDRWLRPVCLTGFKEPLEDVKALVGRLGKKYPNYTNNLFFMSDGCDNQWSRTEILKAVEEASTGLSAAAFVEYGYYADRPLLAKMAEMSGGVLIFAEHFDKYAPELEANLSRGLSGAPRVEVHVESTPVEAVAFAISNGCLNTYGVENGNIAVPEDTEAVYYLSPVAVGKDSEDFPAPGKALDWAYTAAYAAVSLFSVRMKPDVVLPLLKALGDVYFIERFGGCFGKQKYSEFMEETKAAGFDASKRLIQGYDPTKVPADDAFTVFDLLRILTEDEGTRLLLDHKAFLYNRISRGQVDANTVLTAEEQAEMAALSAQLGTEKNVTKLKEIQTRIAEITNKPEALKFQATEAPNGYEISNLTYNEEKPNISVLVRKEGTVDISARLPEEYKGKVPEIFPSFIYRNYAIVMDGLVNVDVLPVKISEATRKKLPPEILDGDDGVTIITLRGLPTVNRQMVKASSAKALFELEWSLTKAKAEQKVYNTYFKDMLGGKKSAGFVEKYGDAAAEWLKEQGFTDYSGFGPKRVQDAAKDFRMARELAVSIKGFSSLPSLKDVKEKMAKGKLTPSAALMAPTVKLVEDFLASDVYKQSKDQPAVLKAWLEGQTKGTVAETRKLIREKAQKLFTIIVGQVWFVEFSSVDENTMELTLDGAKLACKAEMKEVRVDI